MRVLLIQPPFLNATSSKVFPSPSHACLAAALRPLPGVEVKIFDGLLDRLYLDQDEQAARDHLQRTIRDFQPDLVGVTHAFTWYHRDMAWTTDAIREATDAPLVMGGTHATVSYEDLLTRGEADIVVCGEGELTIIELVQRIQSGESLTNTIGTAGIRDGEVYVNDPRPLIEDINTLPMPAWDLFPMQKYFSFNSPVLNMRRPKTIMLTSRGCMGSCVFCACHNIWGRRNWRARSPEKVLEEIDKGFKLGYHKAAKMAEIMCRANIWAVSNLDDDKLSQIFITPKKSIQEALDEALAAKPDSKVVFLMEGSITVPNIG